MQKPNVILKGGPAFQLNDEDRIRFVADTSSKLKLLKGNRYEHFEPTQSTIIDDNQELQVFTWSGYTYVAE